MQDAPHWRVLALPAKVRLDKHSSLIAEVSLTKKKQHYGPFSPHFIFFVTYEWA